jgi:hypothetical protein
VAGLDPGEALVDLEHLVGGVAADRDVDVGGSLPIRTSVRLGIGWVFDTAGCSEPTPFRSMGVPLKLLSLKPTAGR